MLTYFTFLYCYSVLSCLGLIKDLFLQNYSIVYCEPQIVVNSYKNIYKRNINVLMYCLGPFFMFLEVVYYMSNEYNYFLGIIQTLFSIYSGYVLHRLICINLSSRNYEFDRHNENKSLKFMFRMCNRDYFEIYCLYLLPLYAPLFIIGANKFAYDSIFVLFMTFVSMYYSNNEKILDYLNNFMITLKLDIIDSKIDTYISVAKEEYYKIMNQNPKILSDNTENLSEDNTSDEDNLDINTSEDKISSNSEDYEKVDSNADESISNEDFNNNLKDSLNIESKKEL